MILKRLSERRNAKKIHLQRSNSNWYKLQAAFTEGCWVAHFSLLKQCISKATLHLILEDSLINLNAEALQKQKTCYATFGFTEPSNSIIFTSFSMFPLCLILLLVRGCRCLCLFPTAKTVLSYNVMATIQPPDPGQFTCYGRLIIFFFPHFYGTFTLKHILVTEVLIQTRPWNS